MKVVNILVLTFAVNAALPRDLRVLAVPGLVADVRCQRDVVATGTAVFDSPEGFRCPKGFRFRVFVHCVSMLIRDYVMSNFLGLHLSKRHQVLRGAGCLS